MAASQLNADFCSASGSPELKCTENSTMLPRCHLLQVLSSRKCNSLLLNWSSASSLSLDLSLPSSSYLLSSLPSLSFPLTPHLHLFFLYPSFSSPTSRHFNHSFLLFFLLYLIRRLLSAIHPLRLLQPSTVRSVSISQHIKPVKRSKKESNPVWQRGAAAAEL